MSEPMSEPTPAGPAQPQARFPETAADGAAVLWDHLRGLWRFAALHAMIDLGCADHLAGGPLTVAELAGRCGAQASALERVLRAVAQTGLVKTAAPGTYALTEAGTVLRTGATPAAPRLAVRQNGSPDMWHVLGALPATARTGRWAFADRYETYYDYLAGHPEAKRVFHEFMVARSGPLAARVAQAHDFSGAQTVVDVGGGSGTFIAAVLRANPHLRGTLLDLEQTLPEARGFLASQGVADRCEFVAGDFFTSVPSGADVYLLANVVHNWADDDALRILRSVRTSLKEQSTLLLVDILIPGDDLPHIGKDLDIRMLSQFGGLERDESAYFGLLSSAGLRVSRTAELMLGLHLIAALPA